MSTDQVDILPCWAHISFMGDVDYKAYVSQVEIAGAQFLKVEPLGYDGTMMTALYYRPETVYSLTPISEEQMRADIERVRDEVRRRDEMLAARQLAPVAVMEEFGEPDEGDEPDPRDRY